MRKDRLVATLVTIWMATTALSGQPQVAQEISPRITRVETWFWAIANHTPGALDDAVRRVAAFDQEQLRFIWMEVSTVVSMIREPDVDIFFVVEPPRPTGQPVRALTVLPSRRQEQVLYRGAEQRRLREIADGIAPRGTVGPENDMLKRGAMLHADIAMTGGAGATKGDSGRRGPVSFTLFLNDGQEVGRGDSVNHFNMGRRLMDRVRASGTKAPKTVPDPGHDDTVRRWYLATCAFMARVRQIEAAHFDRAIELFPDDAEILMSAAAIHESFAGVRTQSALRKANVPRDAPLGVQDEGAELRRAEQLYKRALDANPSLVEARIRLGRVLGLRGRHEDAVEQLGLGLAASEPLLQYYAHLFLARELEALGNGAEARRSYERAMAIHPTASSALLGFSRVADQTGDHAAARDAIARMLRLPAADAERADPWWAYEYAQSRNVDRLLVELRAAIAGKPL